MKRFFSLIVLIVLALSCESALAAKARSISSDADSVYHAEHLKKHLSETYCFATGNYIKTRSKANGNKVVGHLEQADKFILLDISDGWAQIEVTYSDKTSPDSWDGMTGWVDSDYIDCNCNSDAYHIAQNSSWKAAYRKFIIDRDNYELTNDSAEFWLAYINSDDIPELVIDTHVTAGGCYILTYHDGKVNYEIIGSNGISWYIAKHNLLLNSAGQQGNYYDDVYSISHGEWNRVYHAENYELPSKNYDVDQELIQSYYINNQRVTKEEYNLTLNSYFDKSNAIMLVNGINAQHLFDALQ